MNYLGSSGVYKLPRPPKRESEFKNSLVKAIRYVVNKSYKDLIPAFKEERKKNKDFKNLLRKVQIGFWRFSINLGCEKDELTDIYEDYNLKIVTAEIKKVKPPQKALPISLKSLKANMLQSKYKKL